MLKPILNYFKNRNNHDIKKQDYEIELKFTVSGLVIFAAIVYFICKFI